MSSDNFVVVDCTNGERVIGETDFTSGPATLHEKAIYILEGQLFQVERLDFDGRKAYLRAVDCDYYTDAITYTKVTILDTFASGSGIRDRDPILGNDGSSRTRESEEPRTPILVLSPDPEARGDRSHGEVHVVSRVVGFKKIKFYTNENVGSGELDLPEQQMHTSSYWLTIPASVMASLPFAGDDRRDGVVGLAFAMKNIAQLLLMCDRHDIGLSVDGGTLERSTRTGGIGGVPDALATEPNVFIYDNYPGGIGFSRPLFEMHAPLLERTRDLIAGCPCESGCPSCVGPEGNTGPHAKQVASRILDRLLEARGGLMDLSSRLRAIVKGGPPKPVRELTYEPDTGGYEAVMDIARVGAMLGGRVAETPFGQCLVIDRRYEADRFHGTIRVGDCDVEDCSALGVLDPSLSQAGDRGQTPVGQLRTFSAHGLHRPRDDRPQRRRGNGRVPGRVRILRSGGVPGAAVSAHQLRGRARAAVRGRGLLRRRRPDRHLQRQDLRRAGHGDALDVPPPAHAAR